MMLHVMTTDNWLLGTLLTKSTAWPNFGSCGASLPAPNPSGFWRHLHQAATSQGASLITSLGLEWLPYAEYPVVFKAVDF